MLSLSVIVLTFNEEANLPACLDSLKGWAKEVFVVDSHSTDRTVDIALERKSDGVRVVQHVFENYSAQWNWALSHLPLSGAWTMKLDADERVTCAFKEEAERLLIRAPSDLEGVYFRRRIVFMGRALRWGGMTENYDLRLWRTGKSRFEQRAVNEHALVKGRCLSFRSFIRHHTAKSLADWLEKHNRYSSLEARSLLEGNVTGEVGAKFWGAPEERRMWLRRWYYRLPFRALLYFLYRYVLRLGFLDGRAGFRYAFLHASFLYWIDLKMAESRRTAARPEVAWPPRGQAHPKLAESALSEPLRKSPAVQVTGKPGNGA